MQIKAITALGRDIAAGKRFDAPDGWLDGLSVTVNNVSGKRIEHLQLEFMFLDATPGRPPALVPLSYGRVPGLDQEASHAVPALDSGADASLKLASKSEVLGQLFDQGSFRRDTVLIRLARVIFDDGTGWAHGRNTRRDAHNPLRWNVLDEKESASSRTRSDRRVTRFTPASFIKGAGGGPSLRKQNRCYRWRNYDIIPCNQCGDTISSDNFDICQVGFDDCTYKPKNMATTCGSTEGCYNIQYWLQTWYCDGEDDI